MVRRLADDLSYDPPMIDDRRARLRAARPLLTALPDRDPVTVRDALDHQLALWRADPDAPALASMLEQPLATDDDIRAVLAREHYFRTWDNAVAHGDRVVDRAFEAAADAIVDGDLAALERLLADHPALARARSAYGHRQTLLHHVAANGIELVRQWQSPPNAPAIARALLAAGADPDATCESYRGDDTALTLVCSSVHPHAAGVQADLVTALCDGGARVDGIAGDGAPLWTATIWGYPKPADALLRAGARVDNLVLAAATGDVARVDAMLAEPRRDLAIPCTDKVLPAAHVVEYALIYAANLDRRDVVARLLALGPDLSVRDPIWDATARGVAEHHGYRDIVALLP